MSPEMDNVKTALDGPISTTIEPVPLQPTTKSSIIDQELNRYGMGRYQWLIWAICGVGILLDIMWAHAFGLVVSNMQREFGFSDKQFGNIAATFCAGLTVGSFVWGVLVDVIGRRVAFLGTSFITGAFGMCIGAQSSYNHLLVFITLTGIGLGGNVPVDSTITSEYLPKDRFYLLAALMIFQPLGVILSTLIAFALVPTYSCSPKLLSCNLTGGATPCCSKEANMGWRYLCFTIASITLGVFLLRFFIFPFYESPRFLISKGNDEDAVDVVHKIAAFNRRPCELTVESLHDKHNDVAAIEETGFSKRLFSEISRLKMLFGSWGMIRITIIVCITWMCLYWGLSIVNTYLPAILQRKNSAINVGLEQTYVDYLIAYSPGIAATVLSVFMVREPRVGRKWTMVFSSMVLGISLFLYSVVNTEASRVGFTMLAYFCQCLFAPGIYGWTPEAFPAAVRGTATGLALCFANLTAIYAPLIAEQVFSSTDVGSNAVLYLGGSGLFVSTIALVCLPTKDMVASR